MKRLSTLLLGALALTTAAAQTPRDNHPDELPFAMPEVTLPAIPEREATLTGFGGDPSGARLSTEAFAAAIDHLAAQGGGTLRIPAGVWHTGPIVLRSNIRLEVERGAIILFSNDKSLYPLVETSFEGYDNTRRCQSPISARGARNIAITGQGVIDGNGEYWRPLKREKVNESTWRRITARGGCYKRPTYWFPSEQALRGDAVADMNVPRTLTTDEEWAAVKDFLRPVMVSLIDCENILLQGVVFQNSPAWNIHPLLCRNLTVDGVTVRNPSYAQNGDGIDIESCRNVIASTWATTASASRAARTKTGAGAACRPKTWWWRAARSSAATADSWWAAKCRAACATCWSAAATSCRPTWGCASRAAAAAAAWWRTSTSTTPPCPTSPPNRSSSTSSTAASRPSRCSNRAARSAPQRPYRPWTRRRRRSATSTSGDSTAWAHGGEMRHARKIVLDDVEIVPAQGPALKIADCDETDLRGFKGEIAR